MTQLRIRFLREHGIEGAEKTTFASLPVSAVFVSTSDKTVGASIARLLLRLCRQFVTVPAQLVYCHCRWRIARYGEWLRCLQVLRR